MEHLRIVVDRLRKNSLKLRRRMCIFAQKETTYLGVIVGNGTLRSDLENVKAVKDWPRPSTQKELKSFVQFCSNCHVPTGHV